MTNVRQELGTTAQSINQSINQSFILSVLSLVILQDKKKKKSESYITYNLLTGLWTISLTMEVIPSVLYKISLTVLQALKSYPFFWNNSVAIGHSSSMWLTDRTLLQTHVTFLEFRWNLHITLAKYFEQEDIADLLFSCSLYTVFSSTEAISWDESSRLLHDSPRQVKFSS